MKIKVKRFQKYLDEIKKLKEQNASLQAEIENGYYAYSEAESRVAAANRRANAAYQQAEEQRQQADNDRWYHDEEIRKATKDLDRAVAWNDEWGISRAKAKLDKAVRW